MMKPLSFLAMICAAALSALAQPASANTAYAAGQGAVNSIDVGIEVRASVRHRCGFAPGGAPSGSLDQSNFDASGFSKDFAITLNCTGASRIAVSSSNGGLAADGDVAPGFQGTAPYQVALRMVADNGQVAASSCGAAALANGGTCAFAGTAGTSTGLRLAAASTRANGSYLRVSAPAYTGASPLAAGRYSDTLTVTVSVAP